MANTPERMKHDPLAWLLGDDDESPEPAPRTPPAEADAAPAPETHGGPAQSDRHAAASGAPESSGALPVENDASEGSGSVAAGGSGSVAAGGSGSVAAGGSGADAPISLAGTAEGLPTDDRTAEIGAAAMESAEGEQQPEEAGVGAAATAAAEWTAAPDGCFTFEESVTVEGAAELKERLLGLLDGRDEVRLDADAVARVDAAGLQLLTAFCAALEQQGGRVLWSAVSDPLRSPARLTGLERALRLP